MKIITSTEVYVQKIDLEFIKYTLHSLPQPISSKVFENSKLDVDDFNKYDFFRFDDKDDIEFFRNTEWIIDFNKLKNLTDEEITKLGISYVEKREKITEELYSMKNDDKDYNMALLQYKIINHQITSLNDFIDFKDGRLKFRLPDNKNKMQKLMNIFSKRKTTI